MYYILQYKPGSLSFQTEVIAPSTQVVMKYSTLRQFGKQSRRHGIPS